MFLKGKHLHKTIEFANMFKHLRDDQLDDAMIVKLRNCALLDRNKKKNILCKHTQHANEYNLDVHYPWDRKAYLDLITDFKKKMYNDYNKIIVDKLIELGIKNAVEYNLHGCLLVL